MKSLATTKNVLIVEDDGWFAESAVRTISTIEGVQARSVPSAQEAAEAVAHATPDLIILDLFLPEGNGLQLVHELRGYDDSTDIPIILCSSAGRDVSLNDLTSYGVLTILDKATLTPAELRKAVSEVLFK